MPACAEPRSHLLLVLALPFSVFMASLADASHFGYVHCRHFSNRSSPQFGDFCDQRLGAVSMPSVLAELKVIGDYISGNH